MLGGWGLCRGEVEVEKQCVGRGAAARVIIEAVIRGRGAATGYSRLIRACLLLLPRSPKGGVWQKKKKNGDSDVLGQ